MTNDTPAKVIQQHDWFACVFTREIQYTVAQYNNENVMTCRTWVILCDIGFASFLSLEINAACNAMHAMGVIIVFEPYYTRTRMYFNRYRNHVQISLRGQKSRLYYGYILREEPTILHAIYGHGAWFWYRQCRF